MFTKTSADPRDLSARLRELESRLGLQEDENQALKENVRVTLRAKEDEIAILRNMMTEMRRVFADSLKSLKRH